MKYSFQDIEEMRRMTADLIRCDLGYFATDELRPEAVEDRLRTYLANEITVDDMRPIHQNIAEQFKMRVDRLSRL